MSTEERSRGFEVVEERERERVTAESRSDRSPDEILEEIDYHRAEMERTLAAMERKLTPERIFDEAFGYIRRGPGEYFDNLGDTVKTNPVPTALVGIGLGWLAMSGRHTDGARRGHLKERASEVRHRVGEKVDDARATSREGMASLRHVMEEQPLVLGALGIALGMAMGAGVPHTRSEDELMGEKRDDLVGRAKGTAKEAWEGTKETARSTAEAVERKTEDERREPPRTTVVRGDDVERG